MSVEVFLEEGVFIVERSGCVGEIVFFEFRGFIDVHSKEGVADGSDRLELGYFLL